MAGVDPYSLDATALLDVAWAALVDGFPMSNRETVIVDLSDEFDEHPLPPPEERGASVKDQKAAAAMYALAGGPAPARPADAPVPDAVRRIREGAPGEG